MYVKMLDGRDAGKVVDLRNDVALDFLQSGRADHAFRDPAPEAPKIQAAVVKAPTTPAKKKRGAR